MLLAAKLSSFYSDLMRSNVVVVAISQCSLISNTAAAQKRFSGLSRS